MTLDRGFPIIVKISQIYLIIIIYYVPPTGSMMCIVTVLRLMNQMLMVLKLHYHFFIVVGLLFDTSIPMFKQFFPQINHSACNVLYVPEEAHNG